LILREADVRKGELLGKLPRAATPRPGRRSRELERARAAMGGRYEEGR